MNGFGWRMRAPLIAILCVFSLASDTLGSHSNLISNGGFEARTLSPWGAGTQSNDANGWWNSLECRSTATLDTTIFHGGNASLRIDNSSPRSPNVFGSIAQRVVWKPNMTYRVRLWARGENLASHGAVSVIVDREWRIRPITLPAGSFPWTRFEGTFTAPVGSGDIRILSEDKGRVWIDDITVTESEAGQEAAGSRPSRSELPIPGAVWRGRSGDGWDFVMSEPAISTDGTIRYRYAATHEAPDDPVHGDHPVTGIVDVTFLGRHMKATLATWTGSSGGHASARRSIDATFIPDGRYAYAVGSIVHGNSRVAWWATLDAAATVAIPERVDLNTVSVSELEAAGLSARCARSVVEERIFWGQYRSVNEALAAPGLTARNRTWLQSKSYVR